MTSLSNTELILGLEVAANLLKQSEDEEAFKAFDDELGRRVKELDMQEFARVMEIFSNYNNANDDEIDLELVLVEGESYLE